MFELHQVAKSPQDLLHSEFAIEDGENSLQCCMGHRFLHKQSWINYMKLIDNESRPAPTSTQTPCPASDSAARCNSGSRSGPRCWPPRTGHSPQFGEANAGKPKSTSLKWCLLGVAVIV